MDFFLGDNHDPMDEDRIPTLWTYSLIPSGSHFLLIPNKNIPKKCVPIQSIRLDIIGEIGSLFIGCKSKFKLPQEQEIKEINQGKQRLIIGVLRMGLSPL